MEKNGLQLGRQNREEEVDMDMGEGGEGEALEEGAPGVLEVEEEAEGRETGEGGGLGIRGTGNRNQTCSLLPR